MPARDSRSRNASPARVFPKLTRSPRLVVLRMHLRTRAMAIWIRGPGPHYSTAALIKTPAVHVGNAYGRTQLHAELAIEIFTTSPLLSLTSYIYRRCPCARARVALA